MSDIRVEAPGAAVGPDRALTDPAGGRAALVAPAVRTYRDLHVLPGGPFPQVQGLLAEDIAAALADPRTITAELTGPDHAAVVPLLTPVDLVGWYSAEFREERFGPEVAAGVPMWHLSTFPSAPDEEYERAVGEALERIADDPRGAVVFADHAERDDDPSAARLTRLLSAVGAEEADLWDGGPAREHYFAGWVGLGLPPRSLDEIDLRTEVTGPTRDEGFLDELWAIYEGPFLELAKKTPLRSHFTKDELRDALASDGVIQILHRIDGRMISWLMTTTDIGSFPWMVAEAFYAVAPHLPPERFHVFPGLVTDAAHRGNNHADKLFLELAYALDRLGDEQVLVFETLDENAAFLPALIEAAAAAIGCRDLAFRPVGVQVHRAWTLR